MFSVKKLQSVKQHTNIIVLPTHSHAIVCIYDQIVNMSLQHENWTVHSVTIHFFLLLITHQMKDLKMKSVVAVNQMLTKKFRPKIRRRKARNQVRFCLPVIVSCLVFRKSSCIAQQLNSKIFFQGWFDNTKFCVIFIYVLSLAGN